MASGRRRVRSRMISLKALTTHQSPTKKLDPIDQAKEAASSHAEMYRERFLTTELALWAALISLAGILVSAASVIVAVGAKPSFWYLLGTVVFAGLSTTFLILNFRARRSLYQFLGQPPPNEVWQRADALAQYVALASEQRKKAVADQRKSECREKIGYAFLILSGILLIIGSYFSR